MRYVNKIWPGASRGLAAGPFDKPAAGGCEGGGKQRVRYKLQGNNTIAASMPKYLHNEFIKINDLSQGRPSFPSCT